MRNLSRSCGGGYALWIGSMATPKYWGSMYRLSQYIVRVWGDPLGRLVGRFVGFLADDEVQGVVGHHFAGTDPMCDGAHINVKNVGGGECHPSLGAKMERCVGGVRH